MQHRFDRILAASGLRPPLLLAVSGGVDSMVLADLFLHASDPAFRDISVAHCNFHLRGADSDADQALVADWCGRSGVPFFHADFDTCAETGKGESLEMAARRLRYAWLGALCRERGFTAVVVAHQEDDNVETFFLNLLRGTGPKGLCGMRMLSRPEETPAGVPLFRPLLSFSREELLSYARDRGLSWREDATNADVRFRRNRIRHELFPVLARIHPGFRRTLTEDMARLQEMCAVAEEAACDLEREVEEPPEPGEIRRLGIERLSSCRHLHFVLHRLLAPYGFPSESVDALTRLLLGGAPPAGRTFYGRNFRAEVSATHVLVFPDPEDAPAPMPLTVPGPGIYPVGGRVLEISETRPPEDRRQEEGFLLFDADRLCFPFTVRGWRRGDWMHPLGLRTAAGGKGRKKLSDMFTDWKYAASEKRKALVIEGEGSHVLAVLCRRMDASVRVTDQTVRAIRIRFI